mgnify:CR=1 FL=1
MTWEAKQQGTDDAHAARGAACLARARTLAPAIAAAAHGVIGATAPSIVTDHLNKLGEAALAMLRLSLEALMEMDADAARKVLADDDEVDELFHHMLYMLLGELRKNPEEAEKYYTWLRAAKSLERVADLTTNLAEDVIYSVEGEIVRHGLG